MRATTWLLVLLLALQIASCAVVSPLMVVVPTASVARAGGTWLGPELGRFEMGVLWIVASLVLMASLLAWMLPTALLSARWDDHREQRHIPRARARRRG